MRVLVVDDEEPARNILVHWVRRFGFEATGVSGAEAALAEMERLPAEIVITDINMPLHDGVWLLDRLHERWPKTILIMESGVLDPETVLKTKQHGAVDFLPKPYGREMVYQALERASARFLRDNI